jgi:DNA-binding beta-propeller fold protein YncE
MKFTRLLLVFIGAIFLLESCDPTTETKLPKATHLYFTDYNGERVGVIDLSAPGSFTTLADASDGLDSVSGMAVDFKNGKIYVVEEWTDKIKRFNIDGSGSFETLYEEADGVSQPTAVAVDANGNGLYWANSGSGQIMKGDLTGTAAIDTLYDKKEVIAYSYGLAIDTQNKILFFSDLSLGGIWYGRLDGTGNLTNVYGRSAISTTIRNPSGIFVDKDASRLYWADEGLGVISSGPAAGGTSVGLFNREDGITRADGIAVDKGSSKVYWTETDRDTNTYTIFRGNLDGTEGREVILEGVESYCIVLKFDNQ